MSRQRNWIASTAAGLSALSACAVAGVAGTAHAAPAWCSGPVLDAGALPEVVDRDACDLRGRVVRAEGGAAVRVPADETSVLAHVLRRDGRSELGVTTERGGSRFRLHREAPEPRRTAAAALAACKDGAFNAGKVTWPKGEAVKWSYHAPPDVDLGVKDPAEAVGRGVKDAFEATTDCEDLGPKPDIEQAYQGTTDREPNIAAAGECGKPDGTSVIGWRNVKGMSDQVLAMTCQWGRGGTAIEGDTAMRAVKDMWWEQGQGTCPKGRYYASAVATHETLHVLGLGHVSGNEHDNLTMSPTVAPCDAGPSTLGKGDYLGLIKLYGERS
ncbi:matrixin family metalloprotease [Actinomadura flavalba]|uniref:matrixin family metalloprotease n=1 Tax=Actinomadura flavalba TaxID=1120938 RepID=UPI000366C5AB|nr:matrixin family metalloprotease [Actinomadura flavalba]